MVIGHIFTNWSRNSQQINSNSDIPFHAVAAKEGRYDRDCYGRCGSVYGFSGPDFTSCLDECRIGGQKLLQEKTTVPIAVSAKMARSYDSCVRDYCTYLAVLAPAYGACLTTCYFTGRIGSLDTVEPYPFTYNKADGKKFLPATSNSRPTQPKYSGQLHSSIRVSILQVAGK